MFDSLVAVATVPTVVALVNVCKRAGLPVHFCPAVAVGFGLVCQLLLWLAAGGNFWVAVVAGVLLGLSASGVYDMTSTGDAQDSDSCEGCES